MNLFRGAQKLNTLLRSTTNGSQGLSLLLRNSSRRFFSIENGQPEPEPQPQPSSSPIDSTGLVYGKLLGIYKNTLKTDIIKLFEESNLTLDDIKVEYSRFFKPQAMLVQFPSMSDFAAAIRMLNRKGRLFRLDLVYRQQWDYLKSYNGRYVVLQGIPRHFRMMWNACCLVVTMILPPLTFIGQPSRLSELQKCGFPPKSRR